MVGALGVVFSFLIAPPHVQAFILCAAALLVGVSTGKVVVVAGGLLASISFVMVFGVVVDIDTAGPVILVKLGEIEGCSALSDKKGLNV